MEEVCTCISCKNQSWIIYRDHMECSKCKKTYKWPAEVGFERLVSFHGG